MTRDENDKKVRRELLKWYYDRFMESGHKTQANVQELAKQLGLDPKDVEYIGRRMLGNVLDGESHHWAPLGYSIITVQGVEELARQGIPTFLDSDMRYKILKIAYEAERANPGRARLSRADLLTQLGAPERELDANVLYLGGKNHMDVDTRGNGPAFYSATITDAGAIAYESYEKYGVEGVGNPDNLHQRTIGPNDRAAAENMFRDFTELASKDIILIDAYAKAGLYPMLKSIPAAVTTRILTLDQHVDATYVALVRAEEKLRKLEVRALTKADWPFHSRYVIRDREDGWVWDHSFHDAGKTQHTVSEIKPVNLRTILNTYDTAWAKAKVI